MQNSSSEESQSLKDHDGSNPPIQKIGKEYSIDTRIGYSGKWNALKSCNMIAFAVHAVLFIVAVAYTGATDKVRVPVTLNYMNARPGAALPVNKTLLDVYPRVLLFSMNPQWLTAAFIGICAISHFIVWRYFETYQKLVVQGKNDWRWYEYSLSASIMIVNIGLVNGCTDLGSLLLMFFCAFAMIWFGHYAEAASTDVWLSLCGRCVATEFAFTFLLGSLVGVAPWVVIFVTYAFSVERAQGVTVPVVVHFIVFGLFAQFMCFAVVALWNGSRASWQQKIGMHDCVKCECDDGQCGVCNKYARKQVSTYVTSEFWYVALSLTSKVSLALAMLFGFL